MLYIVQIKKNNNNNYQFKKKFWKNPSKGSKRMSNDSNTLRAALDKIVMIGNFGIRSHHNRSPLTTFEAIPVSYFKTKRQYLNPNNFLPRFGNTATILVICEKSKLISLLKNSSMIQLFATLVCLELFGIFSQTMLLLTRAQPVKDCCLFAFIAFPYTNFGASFLPNRKTPTTKSAFSQNFCAFNFGRWAKSFM